MAENVISLPTAAQSFLTVRAVRGGFAVILETPVAAGLKPLRTTLMRTASREAAEAEGKKAADAMQRPFRKGGRA